jgi:hypothetical protein
LQWAEDCAGENDSFTMKINPRMPGLNIPEEIEAGPIELRPESSENSLGDFHFSMQNDQTLHDVNRCG